MAGRWRSICAFVLVIPFGFPVLAVSGLEAVTYTYDDRGRLVQVSRSGAVNDGIQASYTYDKADNRTNVTVSGPGFSISDASVTEGGTLVFTVTKTGTVSGSLNVNYATSNGTATAGSDYQAAGGTLTFLSTDITRTISVVTIDDAASESAETVNLTLSSPTGGATLIDAAGVGTINDNDANCSGVSFRVNDVAVVEGNPLLFAVTKTGSSSGICNVDYATANGTAVSPNDFMAVSGTLAFASNETTKTVSTTTSTAGPNESDEYMYLNLSSATGGATLSDAQGKGTIYNYTDGCLTCLTSQPPPEGE